MGREIVHLVVEQEPCPRYQNPAAEGAVQGRGDGDAVSLLVDNGVMGSLFTLFWWGQVLKELRGGRGFSGIDG